MDARAPPPSLLKTPQYNYNIIIIGAEASSLYGASTAVYISYGTLPSIWAEQVDANPCGVPIFYAVQQVDHCDDRAGGIELN